MDVVLDTPVKGKVSAKKKGKTRTIVKGSQQLEHSYLTTMSALVCVTRSRRAVGATNNR